MCDHVIHLSNFDEIISLYSGSFRINVINYTSKLLPKSAADSLQRLHREPMNQEGLLVMLGFLEM